MGTEQLEDMIVVALGGHISEEIFFKKVTTGASDDFKKCAQIAHGMVTEYGMSTILGTINYAMDENTGQKKFAESTNQMIDEEINRIINEAYTKCRTLLEEKKEIIEKLADVLLEKETLSLPEIVEIMGPRPFPMKETLKEYLQELKDRAVLDEEAIRDEKEREDAYKIEMADKIKFDVDAEEEPEEKEVSEDSAKKMGDGAKDIEKDAEVVKEEKKDDDSEKKT